MHIFFRASITRRK